MVQSIGYAAHSIGAEMVPFEFERRDLKPHDVMIEITHCGICHSDIHSIDDDLGGTRFPVVPGHEIVGRVTQVGSAVARFKVGDIGAIGCYVDSCRVCEPCISQRQHMCEQRFTPSFNGCERDSDRRTWGGFSNNYVADENYVFRIPDTLDSAGAAPLLCAGITVWSPLRKWAIGPGKRVGIVGLGGLGHMAVKLAVAIGAEVCVFTTSPAKTEDALRLGAHHAVVSTDADQMNAELGRFDFILDTVSAQHDINGYVAALKPEGTLCLLGIGTGGLNISNVSIVFGQKCIAGSLIGGVAETQEMIDFCGKRGIEADIELVPHERINDAFARLRRNDVKYRFVVDMQA